MVVHTVGLNFREPPSKGARIASGHVKREDGRRSLILSFSPLDDGLDFVQMQRLRDGQKDTEWARMQLINQRAGKDYCIATKEYPLRGFGVGLLAEWNNGILLVGKKEGEGIKLTAPSGYTGSFQELKHPLLGACREFSEEIGFVKTDKLLLPMHRDTRSVDATMSDENIDIICERALRERLLAYDAACVADGVEGYSRVSLLPTGKLKQRLGLDKISFVNTKTREERRFNGWFYWDPSTAGVTLLFYAKIDSSGEPRSTELVYGTSNIDESQCVVHLGIDDFLTLGARKITAQTYDAHAGNKRSFHVISGGMMKAIAAQREQK